MASLNDQYDAALSRLQSIGQKRREYNTWMQNRIMQEQEQQRAAAERAANANKGVKGAISGALAGATLGSSVAPGWGTVIGGLAGAGLGAWGGKAGVYGGPTGINPALVQGAAGALGGMYRQSQQGNGMTAAEGAEPTYAPQATGDGGFSDWMAQQSGVGTSADMDSSGARDMVNLFPGGISGADTNISLGEPTSREWNSNYASPGRGGIRTNLQAPVAYTRPRSAAQYSSTFDPSLGFDISGDVPGGWVDPTWERANWSK